GLALFYVAQGFGRGAAAAGANAGRLAANVAGGLAAIYWFGLGLTGFFAAIAAGFCLYAVLLVFAVTRVEVPDAANPLTGVACHFVEETMLMKRACASVLATIIGLIGVRQAIGEKLCRPELTINEVEFSDMMPPTLERIWSAVVSVNASACTENSKGYFD